jgi:hypothetical protein
VGSEPFGWAKRSGNLIRNSERKSWANKRKSWVNEQKNPLAQNFGSDKHGRGGYADSTPGDSG